MLNFNELRNNNDPGPLIKIVIMFEIVMMFALMVAVFSFIEGLFVPAGSFIAGELYGISLFATMIFMIMFGTILSCISPEMIDEIKRQIQEEIEKEKENKEFKN